MITFRGGPADGVDLNLRRAPLLLRVTENPRARKHRFDALDQPEDEPEVHELIHVYRLVGIPSWVRFSGAKSIRGYWPTSTYHYLPEQPSEDHTRTTAAWRAWCKLQPIGDARAANLEAHLVSLGVGDPLHFVGSWCRWGHESLAELTEVEGLELIAQAKTAVKQLGAKPPAAEAYRAQGLDPAPEEPREVILEKTYPTPEGAVFRPCREEGCRCPVTFVNTKLGKKVPVERDGTNHFVRCPGAAKFRL